MDVPPAILNILKCGVCGAQLSRGPVYIQYYGAALCGSCYTPETKATRNVQYEALAQLHVFPCKYKELGCEDTVPFVQDGEVISHEETCEHRQWMVCPVLGSARCDWLGPRAQLLQHCEDQHQDLVLQSPCTLQLDLMQSSEKTYLLCALQVLFLLHMEVNVSTVNLYHAVRYLGRSDEAKDFSYTVDIKRKEAQVLREDEVAPQGCLEDTSSLDISSLRCVLGEFDDVTFTVAVQRRVREAQEQKEVSKTGTKKRSECKTEANKAEERREPETREVCAGCDTQVTELVYRDERGWVCERCAPARRACRIRICSHEDVDIKCRKHEWLFCDQRGRCLICHKEVKRGSLSAHRSFGCLAVCKDGATWRMTKGWGRCLVSGAAGIALCWYMLNDTVFDLEVFIKVSSERLREFGCVVRVTQSNTGQVRTYKPDIEYEKNSDWYILVKKTEFSSWDCVFDVLVDITKIVD